jgi:hypothetical protein
MDELQATQEHIKALQETLLLLEEENARLQASLDDITHTCRAVISAWDGMTDAMKRHCSLLMFVAMYTLTQAIEGK